MTAQSVDNLPEPIDEPLGEYLSPGTEAYVRSVEVSELNLPMPFSLEDLANISSIDDAETLLTANDVKILDSTNVFAGGFVNVDDKAVLVGMGMLIIHYEFFFSKKFNCEGVALWAVTERPVPIPGGMSNKVIITDLSTGIRDEFMGRIRAVGRFDGIRLAKGLSSNTYMAQLPDGSETEATTYRLS
jgi:hypothetical protein